MIKLIITGTVFLSGFGFSVSDEVVESPPRVNTSLGYYKTSSNGRKYDGYERIPYARPPTWVSRFGIARTISPWTGVYMAKQFGSSCMQYTSFTGDSTSKVEGSEDCLYLDIYTSIVDDEHRRANSEIIYLLSVMFYIHGGDFQFGSPNDLKPSNLVDRNVTLVTINYRLGSLALAANETLMKNSEDNWELIAPNMLEFNKTVSEINHSKIARLMKQHYLGTRTFNGSTFSEIAKIVSDRIFGYSAAEAARLQAKVNQKPV